MAVTTQDAGPIASYVNTDPGPQPATQQSLRPEAADELVEASPQWNRRLGAAAGFGIPGTPTEDRNFQAWLSVKAVRDIASGLFIFILLAGATPHGPSCRMRVRSQGTPYSHVVPASVSCP